MGRRILLWVALVRLAVALPAAVPAGAEAVVVITGDQHSAYERTAQFVGLVDAIKTEAAGLPLAVLIDGDVFERGNPVARRTAGEIDYAMLKALAQRAPTVLNLGNHEAEFSGLAETVRRVTATGVRAVGDMVDKTTGRPFAPARVELSLGPDRLVIVGLATDDAATYPAEVRPTLGLPEPVAWAKENFPQWLARADEQTTWPVVLSHCGLATDRALLPLVPDGTLFAGAHDHLRLIHPVGRTVYFHSGSWNGYATVAWLCRGADGGAHWEVEQREIRDGGPADADLAALIQKVEQANLTGADRQIVGHLPQAMTKVEAARWVAEAVRTAAKADAAFIGNTTFGSGLPAGDVTSAEFDACVRFDGTVSVAEVNGARLQALLAAANQGPGTPFAQRHGEFQFATGPAPIDPAKIYTIATTDWGAKNTVRYFGEPAVNWQERPELKLKALGRSRLAAVAAAKTAAPAAAEEDAPDLADLYDTGKALFDAFASPEIKEQYEFPSRAQWDAFVAKLQQALASNSLEALAVDEPQVRAALPALRSLPGGDDYADWLEERLDYIEAAKQATAPATAAPQPQPAAIPYLELWRERMQQRAVPERAAALLPVLRRAFAAEGVPPALAWLAEVESTFNPEARSPAGARGLFQLMPATAKTLGLSTWLPDERTDPEKSAHAAAKMLRQLRDRFGSWPLALAAYNAGAGRVQRTLDQQGTKTFAAIAASLPSETRMYVPKVLATLEIRANTNVSQL